MRRTLQQAIALPLAICLLQLPMYGGFDEFDEKEKKTKEEKQAEKEKKNDAKVLSRYEKVKEFSLNKYKTDPEFRDDVDEAYSELMRKHSEEAYRANVERNSRLRTVHEDTWREHFGIYDNLLVQDHVNRIGQRLVPPESEKSYAFKVVANPIPSANTLATGTIYVSTGMISMLESEAQLAYVLAHEMAHVHLDHHRELVMMEEGVKEYNEAQGKKAARIGMIGAIAGGAIGGLAGQSVSAGLGGAAIGGVAGLVAGTLMNRGVSAFTSWDKVQEDQADELAFKAVLATSYDVREVPKLYATMEKAATRDARVQLGFLGSKRRVSQRKERAADLIEKAYKADIEVKAKNGFVSSSAEHRNLMAELKRDNGILAFYHDMFDMAKANLSDALAIRDNDPAVHYFYAKTMKLVGRTEEDARAAKDSFFKATKADSRLQNYGSHLHYALMVAREKGVDPKQVAAELDTYVTNYTQWNLERAIIESYPPNLDSIFEYMSLYGGDPNWRPKVPDFTRVRMYRDIYELGPGAKEGKPEPTAQAAPAVEASPVENVAEKAAERVKAKTGVAVPKPIVRPAVQKKQ